jgi:tRNA pseudouridine38-40 synthase
MVPSTQQAMALWRLTLSYDGTGFHGWQVQPGRSTVQGVLARTIRQVVGEDVLPQGAGRTDAGVHALGQVASFTLKAEIPPARLQLALNHALPTSVRVLEAAHADGDFHARHSACRKTYEYRIFPRRGVEEPLETGLRSSPPESAICSPMLAPYVWDCRWPLALEPLCTAAALVVGRRDFTSFAATDPDLRTRNAAAQAKSDAVETAATDVCAAVRTIYRSQFAVEDGLVVYRVTGSGFLHHMVRNLVGTFVEAGAGRISACQVTAILAARSRSAAGPTAPASGLFLHSVEYA